MRSNEVLLELGDVKLTVSREAAVLLFAQLSEILAVPERGLEKESDEILLDPILRTVAIQGRTIRLTPTEFSIMADLADHRRIPIEDFCETHFDANKHTPRSTLTRHIEAIKAKLLKVSSPAYISMAGGYVTLTVN